MRKHDTQWRDSRLPIAHAAWDIPIPAAGAPFTMVEYDNGEPLAVVNYLRRDASLPTGPEVADAYHAYSSLCGQFGCDMPFLTVRYDPRNWAMQVFGHNEPARNLIGATGWVTVTEEHFVRLLYRIRGRHLPELLDYGVELSTAPWLVDEGDLGPEAWPGQAMSARRRGYEPEGPGIRYNMRNPCADIDLAVIGRRSGQVALLVDYKLLDAYVDPGHKTHLAMSSITDSLCNPIPSMIVRYDPSGDVWRFQVWCLNVSAKALLSARLVETGAVSSSFTADGWTYVDERRWAGLLNDVRKSR